MTSGGRKVYYQVHLRGFAEEATAGPKIKLGSGLIECVKL